MKTPNVLDSASGIRPTSAFLVIASVLVGIAIWVGRLPFGPAHARALRQETDPDPEYAIVDRNGRPLAQFVQRLDLVLSPNALWQAHTPERLIDRLVHVLGGRYERNELLGRLLPDARDGVIRCSGVLNDAQARALDRWIRTGSLDPSATPHPIEGMWMERQREGGYLLCWRPVLALSARMRAVHVPRDDRNPLRWSRKLADGLARCLWTDRALEEGDGEKALEAQRERVWRWLMPSTYAVALRGFDPTCAPGLFQLLNDEGVLHVQMHIARERDRVYPMGAMRLLGAWGYLDQATARLRAERELSQSTSAATADAQLDHGLQQRTRALLAEVHPVSGLELLCARELADPAWTFLERRPASYTFERHTPVRRRDPKVTPRTYFVDSNLASETPRVVTTLDALLQRQVGQALDALMEKHKPAIAMAIAVDVQSGDVLAVDSREAYPFAAFAPIRHGFTPGSTFKVLVMAAALDQGKVTPTSVFDVGHGSYRLGSRTIGEADNPGKQGRVTAADVLAQSLNGGMVQIGPLVPDLILRKYLTDLGYARAPQTGLGPEASGYLCELPWAPNWTHASVSFGHEVTVTLWQHAAALATVIRGGEYLPLRLVDAIEQNGVRYVLPRPQGRRVFQPQTCAQVRSMMQLAAREGTGKVVAGRDVLPQIEVGTKTGTAQKVPTETCLHKELAHQAQHHASKTRCTRECRTALIGRSDHGSCYTSSMCAFGRLPGDEREVMVLVLADEPRLQKYGSRVAGPSAIAILKEALGVTHLGMDVAEEVVPGFAPSEVESVGGADLPWAVTAAEGAL